jgi:hypothetical protein
VSDQRAGKEEEEEEPTHATHAADALVVVMAPPPTDRTLSHTLDVNFSVVLVME